MPPLRATSRVALFISFTAVVTVVYIGIFQRWNGNRHTEVMAAGGSVYLARRTAEQTTLSNSLNRTFRKFMENIHSPRTSQNTTDITNEKPQSLLTLFTTWSDDPSKYAVHNATLANWASFKPVVNPVVFSDNPRILREANKFGWEGLNLTKVATNGLPVLKYMFTDAIKTYKSVFYGYANADIIFTGSLLQTLTSVQYSDTFRTSKSILISGVRTNLPDVSADAIQGRKSIQKVAKEKGALFQISSEDYFITDKSFPWIDIPEIVIGSLAYDNWLIAYARGQQLTTIDTTKTLLAVHLHTNNNYFESHDRNCSGYNKDLLAKLYGNVNYRKGFTNCMPLFTDFENDSIQIHQRTQFEPYC